MESDFLAEESTIQAFLGRGGDYVTGIDNEALDFSQLESYINVDNVDIDESARDFADSLANNEAVKHSVGENPPVDGRLGAAPPGGTTPQLTTRPPPPQHQIHGTFLSCKTNPQHPHLPESPPDSGSEPPFSPQEHHAMNSPNQKGLVFHELLIHPGGDKSHIYPPPPRGPHHHTSPLVHSHPHTQLGGALPPGVHFSTPGTSPGLLCTGGTGTGRQQQQQGNNKKRKLSPSPSLDASVLNMMNIKQEPGLSPEGVSNPSGGPDDDDYSALEFGSSASDLANFMDAAYQCIRFSPFNQSGWYKTCDVNLKELMPPVFKIDADKGFNFSNADEAFVCQKKNHFQVTCHVQSLHGEPRFVKTSEGLRKVEALQIHFFGVKVESPSQTIKVEQSQSDRSKRKYVPVVTEVHVDQPSKVTVGRLHFSETTSNNMRKKGKPNPDQRYFNLVVSLQAQTAEGSFPVVQAASERIIVRASNPGQFENDVETSWQKGHTQDAIFHNGRVGINTDRPDEALVVNGNLKVTGHIMNPSDRRVKTKIEEVDTKNQLNNVQKLKLVHYEYEDEFARSVGLAAEEKTTTGVLAQDVLRILPDAVREGGDIVLPNGRKIDHFLFINKDRIFMENVGAVKELCKVTGNLETRIGELERMNRKLRMSRQNSFRSVTSVSTVDSRHATRAPTRNRCRNSFIPCCPASVGRGIQIIIALLFVTMLVSLIAMSTLYGLEWSHRKIFWTTLTTHHSNSSVTNTTTMRTTIKTTTSSAPSTPATAEYPITRLLPSPLGMPVECKMAGDIKACEVLCCSPPPLATRLSKGSLPNRQPVTAEIVVNHGLLHRLNESGISFTPPSRSTHARPSLDPRAAASSAPMEEVENDIPTDDPVTESRGEDEGTRSESVAEAWSRHAVQKKNADHSLPIGAEWLDPKRAKQEKNVKRRKRRSNEVLGAGEFGDPVVAMEILEFNTVISPIYCMAGSTSFGDCVTESAYNYTYSIPLSKYMTTEAIHLQFHFASTSSKVLSQCLSPRLPRSCGQVANRQGRVESSTVIAVDGQIQVVALDVGRWNQKTYTYRVPVEENETEACSIGSEYLGSKFYEYNFHFHRVCD